MDDSDEEGNGDAAEDVPAGWGRKKSAYYKEGDSEVMLCCAQPILSCTERSCSEPIPSLMSILVISLQAGQTHPTVATASDNTVYVRICELQGARFCCQHIH